MGSVASDSLPNGCRGAPPTPPPPRTGPLGRPSRCSTSGASSRTASTCCTQRGETGPRCGCHPSGPVVLSYGRGHVFLADLPPADLKWLVVWQAPLFGTPKLAGQLASEPGRNPWLPTATKKRDRGRRSGGADGHALHRSNDRGGPSASSGGRRWARRHHRGECGGRGGGSRLVGVVEEDGLVVQRHLVPVKL